MPPSSLPILHLCYHSVVNMGILRSQVLGPMRRLAKDPRFKITVVSGERVGERDPQAEEALRSELAAEGIGLIFFEKRVGPAMRQAKPSLWRRLMAPWLLMRDLSRLKNLVIDFAKANPGTVVQARSYIPAWAALKAKKRGLCQLIFDPRGILPEELQFAQGWSADSRRFKFWKRLERRLLENSDGVIALTPRMAEHYEGIAGPKPEVIPCCVELERFAPSERLPDPERPLQLVYLVGVNVPYQNVEEALDIQHEFNRQWPGGAHVRILSPDHEEIRAMLAKQRTWSKHGETHTCENASPSEIPAILAEADLGILLRAPSLFSEVASPVKFAEYLAAGLPVICHRWIGICEDVLRDFDCGLALSPCDDDPWEAPIRDFANRLRDHEAVVGMKQRARNAAETHFNWAEFDGVYHRLFGAES